MPPETAVGTVICCTAVVAKPFCPVVGKLDTAPPSAFWKVMSTVLALTAVTDVKLAIDGPPVMEMAGVMVVLGTNRLAAAGTANNVAFIPPRAFWKVMVTLVALPALTDTLVVFVGKAFTVATVARALSAF